MTRFRGIAHLRGLYPPLVVAGHRGCEYCSAAGNLAVLGGAAGSNPRPALRRGDVTMAGLGRNLERAAARPGLSIMATEDHLAGTEAASPRDCPGRR
jgi:hypothetical protein